MKVLVFNCGSSSIKYQLYEMPESKNIAKGIVQRIGEENSEAQQQSGNSSITIKEKIENHDQGLEVIKRMLTDTQKGAIKSMSEIEACGHRVVHGGEAFSGSAKLDSKLENVIEDYFDLAPLHNPPNLTGIRAAEKMMGDIPQVACFDTAFHQTIPAKAHLYGLPYYMYEDYKVRKYGFHGTSHRYVARKAAQLIGKHKYDVNLITCHLGNGCSVAAIEKGKSVDTSMGLTPLEGLMMGTRSGDMDPAIVFFLNRKGYSVDDLDNAFNKKSGLLGISGSSNDVRDLEESSANGNTNGRTKLALDMFAYRIKKYIGMYLAVLNGCDAIVMTGGIGENGALMRKRILGNLENLGIIIDDEKNNTLTGKAGEIHAPDSKVKVLVIPTNEEAAIAKDTYAIVSEMEM